MSEITVASTTDTQESVNTAAGLEAEAAEQNQQEESQTQSGAEGGEPQARSAAESETATEEESDENAGDRSQATGNSPRPKGGVQKKIDKLTRTIYEQKEELDALKERLPKETAGGDKKDAAAGPRPKPSPGDAKYKNSATAYEDYIEDLADWKAEQKFSELSAKQRQAELTQAEQERTAEVFDAYNEAAKAARVKYDDFEEVVGQKDLKIPQAVQVAIVEAGEIGPDIAYYLGKHPELCQELAEMSPMRAIARVGQIELQLAQSAKGNGGSDRASSAPGAARTSGASTAASRTAQAPAAGANRTTSPPRSRTQTSAPAPITPVGGSSSKSAVPLGELPYRDYKRIRDKEEAENRR